MRDAARDPLRIALALALGTLSACGNADRQYRGRSARAWAAQLSAPTSQDRVAATEALYHIAPQSQEVVAALVAAMRDTSGDVQTGAALALSTVGSRAVPALTEALGDDHESVRLIALSLMAERGPDAAPATREIASRLTDESERVRIEAAQTLQRIGPAARVAVPQLIAATRDSIA